MQSLDYINPGESGIKSFKPEEFKQKLQERKETISQTEPPYALLTLFVFGRFTELEQLIQEDPSLVASIETKAIKLLNDLCLGKSPSNKDLFPFQAPELGMRHKIGRKVSRAMLQLHQEISKNLSNFANYKEWQAIDFWQLAKEIPEMRYVYAQNLLERNIIDSNLLAEIQTIGSEKVNNPEIKTKLEIEQKYLESFYYRRIGDEAKAEQSKLDYFMLYKPDPEQSAELRSYANEKFFRADQVQRHWQEILDEVDELQADIELQAGLSPTTCDYYKCSDCCSNTFPSMSATEWQYLQTWMEQNNYPQEQAIDKAKAIQAELDRKLEIVNKEDPALSHRGSENPDRVKFTCPFLVDNKCSIYEARPLLCRGFGLSTDNGLSLKTCKYYQNQYRHNASPENERYCYDLANAQMLAATSDRYNNDGKHLIGTIVAWLSSEISKKSNPEP